MRLLIFLLFFQIFIFSTSLPHTTLFKQSQSISGFFTMCSCVCFIYNNCYLLSLSKNHIKRGNVLVLYSVLSSFDERRHTVRSVCFLLLSESLSHTPRAHERIIKIKIFFFRGFNQSVCDWDLLFLLLETDIMIIEDHCPPSLFYSVITKDCYNVGFNSNRMEILN